MNTIKLKSLWDQFVSLGCLSRRKRFAEFLTTTAKQFAMAQVENCDVKDTTTFHVNVVYVLMFDCGFHVALQEWETFLNDIKPELAESSSSIAPSTSSYVSSKMASEQSFSSQVESIFGGGSGSSDPEHACKRIRRKCSGHTESMESSSMTIDSQQNHQLASALTMIKQKDRKIVKLVSEKRMLRQQIRRLNQKFENQSQKHIEELNLIKKAHSFDLHRCSDDSRQCRQTQQKKWSWLTPTGMVNVAAVQMIKHVIFFYNIYIYIFVFSFFWSYDNVFWLTLEHTATTENKLLFFLWSGLVWLLVGDMQQVLRSEGIAPTHLAKTLDGW